MADVHCTRGWGGSITICGPRSSECQGFADWFSDAQRVKTLSDSGLGPAAIARELGIARSSVYTLLEEGAVRRN